MNTQNYSSANEQLIILGFDYGMKYTGVAVGQTITKTAKPLITLKSHSGVPNWKQISSLIKTWKPHILVVGVPLNMDGSPQQITHITLNFVEELRSRFNLPVQQADERLTTAHARSTLFEQNGYKALKKTNIDAMAAKYILEGWMQENF